MSKKLDNNIAKLAAEIGAKVAIETYEKERHKANTQRTDRRLHNTKLLLRNYRMFRTHSENAVFEFEQLDESVFEILDLMEDGYSTGSSFVQSIKTSVARTVTITKHIDVMFDLYETYCYRSANPEDARRYRIVKGLYIDEVAVDAKELAEQESVDVRTIYRDVDNACERIAALIFGIDGIKRT